MIEHYENYTKGNVDFMTSQTRENLMRAFAGESQARNRYTFAASAARKESLEVVARVFEFTAEQERAHAKVFYELLAASTGFTVTVDGTYPVNLSERTLDLLRSASHNEYQEWKNDYASFAQIAYDEGFSLIGHNFKLIADVEKTHGDRFNLFGDLLEQGKLFAGEEKVAWMCLNCGEVVYSTAAPQNCPICRHNQGFFIRLDLAPYTRAV